MTGRLIATSIIWIAVIAAIITLLTSSTGAIANANGSEAFGITMVLAGAASITTIGIWFGAREKHTPDLPVGKAKRAQPRRVEDLIDSLDDQEVYELEALLLAREEEARQRISTR